jgi:hypothetical protein
MSKQCYNLSCTMCRMNFLSNILTWLILPGPLRIKLFLKIICLINEPSYEMVGVKITVTNYGQNNRIFGIFFLVDFVNRWAHVSFWFWKKLNFLHFLPCKEIILCMFYLKDYQLQWISFVNKYIKNQYFRNCILNMTLCWPCNMQCVWSFHIWQWNHRHFVGFLHQ